MLENIKDRIAENTAAIMKESIALKNEIENLNQEHERYLDEIFCEFVSVIDTFERSERIIQEKGYAADENADRAIKRLLNAKKKLLSVLEKYSVKQIQFPDNQIIDELCITVGTEPDEKRTNGEIISIEKSGYVRSDRVIRPAEVVIVKN